MVQEVGVSFGNVVKKIAFFVCALFVFSSLCKEQSSGKTEVSSSDGSFSDHLKKLEIPHEYELNEVVIGDEKAPITVIIYSSFTCTHCCEFHVNELPKFKKKYIDTGKVKVYLRSYLDDLGALESAVLTRCFGKESDNAIAKIYHRVYSKQKEWLSSKDPRQFLKDIFVDLGYDRAAVEKCISNRKISAGLMKEQQRAMHELKITSVPAFVVNGKVHEGKLTSEELERMCKILRW